VEDDVEMEEEKQPKKKAAAKKGGKQASSKKAKKPTIPEADRPFFKHFSEQTLMNLTIKDMKEFLKERNIEAKGSKKHDLHQSIEEYFNDLLLDS